MNDELKRMVLDKHRQHQMRPQTRDLFLETVDDWFYDWMRGNLDATLADGAKRYGEIFLAVLTIRRIP